MTGALARGRLFPLALTASALPFAARGVEYAAIGSFLPLAFAATAAGLLVLGHLAGGAHFRRAVLAWSLVLIAYAAVRLGLGTLFLFAPLEKEMHAMEQMTPLYHASSALYLAFGVYFFRKARSLAAGAGERRRPAGR